MMERILRKVKNPPCPLCSQKDIKLGFETLKTLTKSDLIKIIQAKNDLLVQYVDWVNDLKSEKERESK
jgi:hypothetical protein